MSIVSFLQVTLKLDPETEIKRFGPKPGPLDEIEVQYFVKLIDIKHCMHVPVIHTTTTNPYRTHEDS